MDSLLSDWRSIPTPLLGSVIISRMKNDLNGFWVSPMWQLLYLLGFTVFDLLSITVIGFCLLQLNLCVIVNCIPRCFRSTCFAYSPPPGRLGEISVQLMKYHIHPRPLWKTSPKGGWCRTGRFWLHLTPMLSFSYS